MKAGLYGYLDDSIWEITCISFMPTAFGSFSVVVDAIKYPALDKRRLERRLEFKSDDYQSVFDRFKPLAYFQDKYPEYLL